MDDKKYLLNGEPASAMDLIQKAIELDSIYANSWVHTTSMAAQILRNNGYTVEDPTKKEKLQWTI